MSCLGNRVSCGLVGQFACRFCLHIGRCVLIVDTDSQSLTFIDVGIVCAMSGSMKLKQAQQKASELNRVIHSRNLYSGHSRFISAMASKVEETGEYAVTVENLQTGVRVDVFGPCFRQQS